MAQQVDAKQKEVLEHNKAVLKTLEPGDLVEINRGLYAHWAVSIGGDKVAHLSGDGNDGLSANSGSVCSSSGKSNKASVRVDNFLVVAGDSMAQKNNALDHKHTPFSPEEIVKTAMDKKGAVGYNIIENNCEHFANFCRYGKNVSSQVNDFVSTFIENAWKP